MSREILRLLPETMPNEERAIFLVAVREQPEILEFFVRVPDLYGYLRETEDVDPYTVEIVIAALNHYCGPWEAVFAVLIGYYMAEIADIVPDTEGFRILGRRILRYPALRLNRDGAA
ncbi:MAG TPA: hypothetical protein VD862_04115 [Candidatus Paceibacterota bacterium]|nr:hypothetical protein [Candidatus Paceibacterota bacterium]